MAFLKAAPAVLCMALLGTMFSPLSRADDHDKKTTVTFTEPVEIPGVHIEGYGVLPPGTYVFKLMNSDSNRHIVQIFNQDQNKVFATILAIPNYRLTPTNKTVMTFNEGIGGRPEALRAWFYPGANWGEEFVYPKARAIVLAKASKTPVITVTEDVTLEVAAPEAPAVVAQLRQAPVMAVRPTGEVVELAQVAQTTPTRVAAAPAQSQGAAEPVQVAQNKLPGTASYAPLIGLAGLLSLCGAFAVKLARR